MSPRGHTGGGRGSSPTGPLPAARLPCGPRARALAETGCQSRIWSLSSLSVPGSRGQRVGDWGVDSQGDDPGKEGPRVSRYLRWPRSDSALGSVARSSDKSPRPAREGAAGPGTARPGPRAPPGTEPPRPPTPRSCPGHPGPRCSRGIARPAGLGQGRRPQEDPPSSGPLQLPWAFNHFPAGSPPLTWHPAPIPRQLARLAPLGRPLYTWGPA